MFDETGGSQTAHYTKLSTGQRASAGLFVRVGRTAFLLSLVAAVAGTGCAGKTSRPATRPAAPTVPASWVHTPQAIQREPVKQPEPFDVQRPADLAVVVRGIKDADLDEVDGFYKREQKEIDKMYGTNGELGVTGLAMGGYPGAQIVTGVLILAPVVFTLDTILTNTVTTISDTLKDVDLIAETRGAVAARGIPVKTPDRDAVRALLVVNSYGLVGKYGEIRRMGSDACLIVAADLIIADGAREIFRDEIRIGTSRRSADAPPPSCLPFQDFAEKDGIPLRNAARTYAQVLAAIAVHRIKEMPWKR